MTRRVGIIIGPAARASCNLSSQRMGVEGEPNLQLMLDDAAMRRFAIGAIYCPTLDYSAAEREATLHDCVRLAERLLGRPDHVLFLGGDWNGHISREHVDGLCLGDKGMRKRTSVNGRMLLAWMRGRPLKLADSFLCCNVRVFFGRLPKHGTRLRTRSFFNNLKCVDVGIGDHKMKVIEMTLTSATSSTRRRQRRAKCAAIEEQRKLRVTTRPRLRTDLLAGNSDDAKARRPQYGAATNSLYAQAGLRPHDAPRRRLRAKTAHDDYGDMACRGWAQLADIVVTVAEMVVGREPNRTLGTPWSTDDEHRIQRLRDSAYSLRVASLRLRGTPEALYAKKSCRLAQCRSEKAKSSARRKWIRTKCSELTKAQQRHGMGCSYRLLRNIVVLEGGRSSCGKEYFSLDQMSAHVKSIASDVGHVTRERLDQGSPRLGPQDWIGLIPDDAEVDVNLRGMKETAAGMDEVTSKMLKSAGPTFQPQLRLVVQRCWSADPTIWDSSMHDAFGIFLYKKGDKRILDNNRCIIDAAPLPDLCQAPHEVPRRVRPFD